MGGWHPVPGQTLLRRVSHFQVFGTFFIISFPGDFLSKTSFWFIFHNHTWWFNMKLICVWHISFMNWVFFGTDYKLQFEIAWALIFEHVVFWVCYCHIVRNKVKVLRKLKFCLKQIYKVIISNSFCSHFIITAAHCVKG